MNQKGKRGRKERNTNHAARAPHWLQNRPRSGVPHWLQKQGDISDAEMQRSFNCGVGMTVVVPEARADEAIRLLGDAGETAWRLGRVESRHANGPAVQVD